MDEGLTFTPPRPPLIGSESGVRREPLDLTLTRYRPFAIRRVPLFRECYCRHCDTVTWWHVWKIETLADGDQWPFYRCVDCRRRHDGYYCWDLFSFDHASYRFAVEG